MSLPANIAARRAEEDRLAAARSNVYATEQVGHRTAFEVRTGAKIHARLARERVERGKRAAEEELNRRRARCVSAADHRCCVCMWRARVCAVWRCGLCRS
jgi:hypothetical protein